MDLEIPPEYPAELNKVKSDFIGANAGIYKGMSNRSRPQVQTANER
jgi:hypothetical protein